MENKSYKFILRYIGRIVFITFILIVINYFVIIYFTKFSSYGKDPVNFVKNIAMEIK